MDIHNLPSFSLTNQSCAAKNKYLHYEKEHISGIMGPELGGRNRKPQLEPKLQGTELTSLIIPIVTVSAVTWDWGKIIL